MKFTNIERISVNFKESEFVVVSQFEYLEAASGLDLFHYDLLRIHHTLSVSPTMEEGISRHLWRWGEFLGWRNEERMAA